MSFAIRRYRFEVFISCRWFELSRVPWDYDLAPHFWEVVMESQNCFVCGVSFGDGDTVYGLSSGILSEKHDGFKADDNSAWDLLCSGCMNTVDRLIAEYKMSK